MTEEEILEEEKREEKFNIFSEQIIGLFAWGKFYGLMREASKAGQGAINHTVCVSKDGRSIQVYNTLTGKVIGAFLKPSHEYTTKYLSRREYGKALLSLTGLYGQIQSVKEQKEANCITVTPDEVIERKGQIERKLKQNETTVQIGRVLLVIGLILIIFLLVYRIRIK